MMRAVDGVSEANKHKVRVFVEAVLNEGRLELIDELVAVDFIGHIARAQACVLGRPGLRRLVSSQRRLYPDLYVKIEDEIAEDDRVVTRWCAIATRPGSRAVGSPTGRVRCFEGISIVRLLAGKQVDTHTHCTSFAPVGAGSCSTPVTSVPGPCR
jgi:predicted ester cyclase